MILPSNPLESPILHRNSLPKNFKGGAEEKQGKIDKVWTRFVVAGFIFFSLWESDSSWLFSFTIHVIDLQAAYYNSPILASEMTNMEQHHDAVKKSLSQFIRKNVPGAKLKSIDQIVLEYVISILEEASQDESFDVEGE